MSLYMSEAIMAAAKSGLAADGNEKNPVIKPVPALSGLESTTLLPETFTSGTVFPLKNSSLEKSLLPAGIPPKYLLSLRTVFLASTSPTTTIAIL